jgi:hypothetical protein
MHWIWVSTASLLLGGCATVTRGTTEQITLNSEPPGAQARTSLGQNCPMTPCTFEVSRKSEFIVTFEKDGYEPTQIPVVTKLAGAGVAGFAGNVIVGGIVGMGVDAFTGSTLEHYPSPVYATLVRSKGPVLARAPESSPAPRKARAKAFKTENPSVFDEPL